MTNFANLSVSAAVAAHLKAAGSISHRDAAFLASGVGCIRKEISRLRSEGWKITTERRIAPNGKKYTRWTLAD